MALVPCPECNKKISTRAESCPHCGMPISEAERAAGARTPRSPGLAGKVLVAVLALIGLVWLWPSDNERTTRRPPRLPRCGPPASEPLRLGWWPRRWRRPVTEENVLLG